MLNLVFLLYNAPVREENMVRRPKGQMSLKQNKYCVKSIQKPNERGRTSLAAR